MNEDNIRSYFDQFVSVFHQLDAAAPSNGRSLSQRFFGYNAVDWLGLEKGQTRERLEEFYTRNKIDITNDPPTWMAKLRRG